MVRVSTLLAGATVALAANPPAILTPCDPNASVTWSKLTVTPATPVAGQKMTINGTGVISTAITGGPGKMDAYAGGSDVYDGPFNTCGTGQKLDIDGLVKGTLDSISCPTTAGETINVGVELVLPSFAAGLGALTVFLHANDTLGNVVMCRAFWGVGRLPRGKALAIAHATAMCGRCSGRCRAAHTSTLTGHHAMNSPPPPSLPRSELDHLPVRGRGRPGRVGGGGLIIIELLFCPTPPSTTKHP